MEIKIKFITKRQAEELTGFSCETLKKWRLSGKLIEGVHWIRVGNTQRVVRYNQSLLIDFLQNQQNPLAHERAIEAYLASLPSHKPRKRSRANKS